MKSIVKRKYRLPISLKFAIALLLIIAFFAFVFSLKYSGNNKYPIVFKTKKTVAPPKVSLSGGYYSSPFDLYLSAENDGKIYYTLDGSEPTANSNIYNAPILIQDRTEDRNNLSSIRTSPRWQPPIGNVFKGNVLRAISVDKNNFKSRELVQSYFIKKEKYTFPTISLTINQDDFFGYKNGIYVMGRDYEDKKSYIKKRISFNLPWWKYPANYLKKGDDSERPAHIEFFETNGKIAFEANVRVRINGNATRGFAQKSLRITFDEKYGISELNYKLFPNYNVDKFNSFILRNSGNDWDKTMFRDAFMQSLMRSYLDFQEYRPSILFINGEYWGIHNIRERSDENYLAHKYKISKDSIAILEFLGKVYYGDEVDGYRFNQLLNYFKTADISQDENYQKVLAQIDINSFMDFIIANVYFCNSDWPNNNVKYWRYKTDEKKDSVGVRDGRWRWMLFDTDWGFGYTSSDAVNMNLLERSKKIGSIGIMFSSLMKNKKFAQQFKDRFQFHLDNTFDEKKVIERINAFEKKIEPEIEEHINRWRVIGSYQSWKNYVEELRVFAKERPRIQLEQLNQFIIQK